MQQQSDKKTPFTSELLKKERSINEGINKIHIYN